MGNLMPSGAAVRCSWVAVFRSVLIVASLLPSCVNPGSAQRYQLGDRLLRLGRIITFCHLRNLDALEHVLNALVHLAQRLADRAALGLITFAAYRNASRDEQRPIDGSNHFVSRDLARRARQRIA